MKYAALIFLVAAGALKAEIPAGATDLVPWIHGSAIESLKMQDKLVTTISYSEEITITSIDVPSIYISRDPRSEKKK